MKFLTVRHTWDPLSVLRQQVQEQINRLLDSEIESRALDHRSASYFPLINVSETPEAYLVIAEVPGVQSDDLHIDLSDEGLIVECRRPLAEGTREENFRRQERWYGGARRELGFSRRVKPDEATAELHAGILAIRVPKADPPRRRRIEVSTKG